MKISLLAAFAVSLNLTYAAHAQDEPPQTASEPAQAPAPKLPSPDKPTRLPVSQTNDGVTLTLNSVEFEELPNPVHHNVFFRYSVSSTAPDAQPTTGRALESYVTSPLWIESETRTSPGRVGKVDGERVLAFIAFPTKETHLPMRVSFQDPRVKMPGKDLNRVQQITFEKVPIPQNLNEPVQVNSDYKAEKGALVTLKTVTMVPHRVSGDADKRTDNDRDLVVTFALKQPAPQKGIKSKATLEYIDKEWNSIFFAYDDKNVEWARSRVSFGSPMDQYSNGDFTYTFPVRESPGAQTLSVEFALREIVNYVLPASAFRRFFFDVDLKSAVEDKQNK